MQTKDEFALHDKIAEKEGQEYWTRGLVGYFYRMYLWEAQMFVKHYSSGKILEVGCGEGLMFRDFHREYDICQVDISTVALEKAQQLNDKIVVGDAMNLPFRSGTFDAVLQVAVLEHLSNPEKALAEAWRMLKKGGKLLILIPNDLVMSVGRLMLGKYPPRYPGHLSFLTPQRIKTMVGNRFNMIQEKRMPFHCLPFWFNMYYQVIIKKRG